MPIDNPVHFLFEGKNCGKSQSLERKQNMIIMVTVLITKIKHFLNLFREDYTNSWIQIEIINRINCVRTIQIH